MTPIILPLETITEDVTWQVNGQSPANSPQAIIQFASTVLIPLAQDPAFGIDKAELAKVLLMNSPLANSKGIQLSPEQQQAKQVELLTQTISANPGILLGLLQQVSGGGVPNGQAGPGGQGAPSPMQQTPQ